MAQEITALHPKAKVSVMPLDLASLASTRAFAAAFNAQYQGLDILVNNGKLEHPAELTPMALS